MNDQSTRNCAWGDTATCTPEIQGKSAGWPRFAAGSFSGHEHGHWPEGCPNGGVGGVGCCGSTGPRISSSEDDIDEGHPPVKGDLDRTEVEYRLHEFGLLSPLHAFTHWPGFSLNPALWDLERLDVSYRERYGRHFKFDSTDIRSAQLAQTVGLTIAIARQRVKIPPPPPISWLLHTTDQCTGGNRH